jgi:hypothetical protein
MSGLLLELIIRAVGVLWNKTRPWAFLPDEEGGPGFLGPLTVKRGQLVHGKGDNEKRYPMLAGSRVQTNKGTLYVITRQKGVNLRVPTIEEIRDTLTEGEKQAYFDVCDPLLLANVMKTRTTQETLEGQMVEDSWKKMAIIPLTIVAGLAIIVIGILAGVMAK